MFIAALFLIAKTSQVKNPPANAGDIRDVGLISGSEKSPGEGNGYALQYSGPDNSTDCTVHGITKSRT